MPLSHRRKALLLAVIAYASSISVAFQPTALHRHYHHGRRPPRLPAITMTTSSTVADATIPTQRKSKPSPSGACYYRRADGSWKPRKELQKLRIGERLFATRLPASDLMYGKSGPKAFLECGVGKLNDKGKWSIVNGMARIGRRGMKPGVFRKKIKKMPPNELIEVYVSKIRPDHGSFEVCLNRNEALEKGSLEGRISASCLKAGEELQGYVKQVKDYGVFVDVNANRNGLIHISRVAKQQDRYVNKEEGLKDIGLGRGTPVMVIVVSNEKKRLELDFAPPPPVEESPVDEGDDSVDLSDEEASAWAAYGTDADGGSGGSDTSEDEAAMWAAYAAGSNDDEDDEEDEDTDIEDALGIGTW